MTEAVSKEAENMPVTKKTRLVKSWKGNVAMVPGLIAFRGQAGDNKPHKHWAHQVVVGLGSLVKVCVGHVCYSGASLLIPAGTIHQLQSARVLCLCVDPTHNVCKTLLPLTMAQVAPIITLDGTPGTLQLMQLSSTDDLQTALEDFRKACTCDDVSALDNRFQQVVDVLRSELIHGREPSRTVLAELAHLSSSRFSHWFSEQAGLPFRSYKKWLKLLLAFELTQNMSLTDAAMTAGFSDQAHFCRAAMEAFGVNPATIKQLLSEK